MESNLEKNVEYVNSAIKEFEEIIIKLEMTDATEENLSPNTNLVLGGGAALSVMGVDVGSTINDIDIIVINPTKKQFEYLDSIKFFSKINKRANFEYGNSRVLKFKSDLFNMDIILAKDVPNPSKYTMLYRSGNTILRLNTITGILDAQRSYGWSVDDGNTKSFRKKDVERNLQIKMLNFNL